ncbi:MAG TPA: glucoamylase family protein [Solirubrobacter sp.]|nr:glucoamylase family protein [Solirubrobacter sp.]
MSAAVLVALLMLVAPASASAHDRELREYARDTWASFVAMTDERTGLPADTLRFDGTRSVQTSTTNIGAYMWSAVVAYRLKLISRHELVHRLSKTLATLERMERSLGGQYWNWYDHRAGEKLTEWPPGNNPNFINWLSSVDNGWLAVGLRVVANSVPELARRAEALHRSMDFGVYYVPERNLVRFHIVPGDPNNSPCCYDTVVSESRIVDYIGIARGQLPAKTYFQRWRTFPHDGCAWAWQETKPIGVQRTYEGINVFEGAYPYRGTLVVPSWGGSMFEALMVDLFVPESKWAPKSWRVNHPLTVRAQILHGLADAGYGYWGFSPANVPEGGYDVYGVDAIGLNPDGNASNKDRTLVDRGYEGCRAGKPDPKPKDYTNGVVTPHAAFLALPYAPGQVRANLRRLAQIPGMYGRWGFRDSVNVQTRRVSDFYLSLDQGMIMAALGNELAHDAVRKAFADKEIERGVRPVIGQEVFGAAG